MHPLLPNFFLAEGAQLTDAATKAIQVLGVEGTAAYMIVRDEVALARSYNIAYGLDLEDLSRGFIVGGNHPSFSKIPCSKLSDIDLQQENISTVSVVTAVKRLDKRTDLFAVQQIPRSRLITAEEEFKEIGLLADSWLPGCVLISIISFVFDTSPELKDLFLNRQYLHILYTGWLMFIVFYCIFSSRNFGRLNSPCPGQLGNHGVPCACFAFDNHLSFAKTNKFLLGLLSRPAFENDAFWKFPATTSSVRFFWFMMILFLFECVMQWLFCDVVCPCCVLSCPSPDSPRQPNAKPS